MKSSLMLATALGALVLSETAGAQPFVGPVQYQNLPDCQDIGGSHLNYTASTGVISCGAGNGLVAGNGITINLGTISLTAIADGDVLANITGSSASPVGVALSAVMDHDLGSTEGDILYRGPSAWVVLGPDTSGEALLTQGAAAAPLWGVPTLGAISSGDVLANTTGSLAVPSGVPGSTYLDFVFGNVQGDVLYRSSTGWVILAAGPVGDVFETGGAGANPGYVPVSEEVTVTWDSNTPVIAATLTVMGLFTNAGGVMCPSPSTLCPWPNVTIDAVSVITQGTSTPSFTAALEIGSTTLTGCGAITVNNSGTDVACTAANVVSSKATLYLVVSNVSGAPQGASVLIVYHHPVR